MSAGTVLNESGESCDPKAAVLNALTFGGYGTYQIASALWAGYKDDGVLGALNAVNPLQVRSRNV